MHREWLKAGEISHPPRFVPSQESPEVKLVWLEKTLIAGLLSVIGFMGAYTLNNINASIREMHKDVSSLQISFASLSKHVEDEDANRYKYSKR